MAPFSETAAARIRFLLHSAADSDPHSVLRELCEFADHGYEGSILLMQGLLDRMDFHGGAVLIVEVKPDFISAVFRFLLGRPNFCSVFSGALRTAWDSDSFLANLSKALNLSTCERIAVGLACFESLEFRERGQSFCIAEIEELCANHGDSFSSEQIQEILMFLSHSTGLHKFIDPFLKMLSLSRENFPFVLTPMLSEDATEEGFPRQVEKYCGGFSNDFDNIISEMENDMSVADIMVELGYGCTVDTLHCKEILSFFLPLTEEKISRILTAMMHTLTGLEDVQITYSTFSAALNISQSADFSHPSSWNINVLVDSIMQLAPETNWSNVIESFDHEGFCIPNEEAFSFLITIYSIACKDLFPLNAVCGSIWKNVDGQLSFLRYAVNASPDVFSFAHAARKLPYIESLQPPNGNANQAWLSLDLLEVLCQLAERGCAISVREIIDYPLRQLPEILLLGISHCHTAYNLLQQEISSIVFLELLKNPAKANILRHIWDANSSLVLREFIIALSSNPDSMLRILDLCEELKILVTVLDSVPFSASVKLAVFAFQKDLIDLEKWLSESLTLYKDAFYEACLQFLKSMLPDAMAESSDSLQRSASVTASQRPLSVIFKVLQSHLGLVRSQKISEEMRRLSSQLSMKLQSSESMELPVGGGSVDDVETEANAYFHQMFSGQLGIDTVVQMLGRFKESSDNREQGIFECMISNLFEEYKFFPKYPDKQLKIAAVLFGSLIKNQLVTHLTLGIALRCVLDALRKSVDSKMFLFGAKALEQFTDRLIEWPQYCNHILQISHLRTTHADLVAFIEKALARISSSQTEFSGISNSHMELQQDSPAASMENTELANTGGTQPLQQFLQIQQRHQAVDDRSKSSATSSSQTKTVVSLSGQSTLTPISNETAQFQRGPTMPSSQAPPTSTAGQTAVSSSPGFLRPSRAPTSAGMMRQSYTSGFGAALNIDTLIAAAGRRDTPIEAPASEIQDKIHFMINNISAANLEIKAKEFTELIKEQYYPWFAQYMVMKRASIEPNFHDLYLKFLDKLNSRSLNKEIVKATYENCKVLLRSDLIKSSSEERSLLKNLGSWLGKFTIGRNQVLRAREIDPKMLIIEAYEKGLMIAVIPFTSKILEPCQCSLAYQPPNPWTMAILGLLAEIYNLPNLKMNLKFDIEVLFKNLGVDLKDVKPTSLLKDRVREVEGNPDFSNKDISASQTLVSENNAGILPVLSAVELQHQATGTSHPGVHSNAMSQYTSSLHLPSNTQGDDDKLGTLSMTERVLSGQGQSQVAPSQSSFSSSQILSPAPNILQHLVINSKLSALGFQMQLQRIIPAAIERAVREIITPVVQRSVTIASQTTKELAMKDYAMESDEGRTRNAARLMVSSLAASLAHVTCKEPLRVALSNHIRSFMQSLSVSGELLETAVLLVTNDNLDLGCALIEHAAIEKGLQAIEGEIGPSIAFRRKQREAAGSAYYDPVTYAQGPFARVPEALRPKPGRLSINQQRVYEEFVRYPCHDQPSNTPSVMPTPASTSSSGALIGSSLPRISGAGIAQPNSGIYTAATGPGFSGASQPSDPISEEMDSVSAQILSASATRTSTNDIVQQIQDPSSVISQFSLSGADLLTVEASSMAKEFGAVMPPSTALSEGSGIAISEQLLSTADALEKYQIVAQKVEALISKDAREGDIQVMVAEVLEILSKCINQDESALAFAQMAFRCLYENPSNTVHTSTYLTFLEGIREVCKHLVKELTNWVIYLDDEKKLNIDITFGLIKSELLNVAEFGLHLSKIIDGGRHKTATEFAISLVRLLLVQEAGVNLSDFHDVIDVLSKLAVRPGSSESLQQLLEVAVTRNNNVMSIFNAEVVKDTKQTRDLRVGASRSAMNVDEYTASESSTHESAGFGDQVALLFNEWIRISELPVHEAACTHYLSQLHQNGFLKGDDQTERFLQALMEIAVGHCVASEKPGPLPPQPSQQTQPLSFLAIDGYAKLIVFTVKCSPDQANRVLIFSKFISVMVRFVQKDAEERKLLFNPRPYFRLVINLLLDLTAPDPALDSLQFVVLTYFANTFHALQPLKVPGWSFAWLELISHRNFMPKLLLTNSQKGWPFFQRLLVDLFKFMEPYLRNAELPEPVQFLYKGTLRVLLVLLHDFPEFLCEYHFSFCDVIPPSCIQMRNVILSAFPINMRLPDPCTPNLKIDLLPEINQPPRILSEIDNILKAKQIKADIDEYLKTRRQESSFLVELKQKILLSPLEASVAGTRYNVPFINSLILYVGMQTILQQPKLPSPHIPSSQVALNSGADIVAAAVDIYNIFVIDTDSEGRYHFLNAVANQLRYPNNHTHYFSCILLYLFAESNQDVMREQITRVLLERLIVNRPHPWGLLITFIELIKNPRYNFWKQSFIHLAPDIEKLFESVSRSCGASRGVDEGLISGGLSDGSH